MAAGSIKRQRLAEARAHAVAAGFTNPFEVRVLERGVLLTLLRPEAECAAGTEYVRSREAFADAWDEECGPLWLGHALHAAFLCGVDWVRGQDE